MTLVVRTQAGTEFLWTKLGKYRVFMTLVVRLWLCVTIQGPGPGRYRASVD